MNAQAVKTRIKPAPVTTSVAANGKRRIVYLKRQPESIVGCRIVCTGHCACASKGK